MQYGLKSNYLEGIKQVLASCKEIEKAILYGSRAKGNYTNSSDIDIALVGEEVNLSVLARIETKIDDLFIPYKADVSIFHQLTNTNIVDHIIREGVVLYEKSHSPA